MPRHPLDLVGKNCAGPRREHMRDARSWREQFSGEGALDTLIECRRRSKERWLFWGLKSTPEGTALHESPPVQAGREPEDQSNTARVAHS